MKTKLVTASYSAALILFSLSEIFMMLASGHEILIEDLSQMKVIIECVIFFFTAIALLFLSKLLSKNYVLIILLYAVQLSLVDYYIDISNVNYGANKPYFIFWILLFLSVINILCIYF